jgi:exopolysaccharide biosynthesis polyprenyl glycosylphosphotransferase
MRVQVHKVVDAGLFCVALRLAHLLRSHLPIEIFGGTAEIRSFEEYVWLYVLILPAAPLVLAAQGFYSRPLLPSRRQTVWQLFWASTWMTMGVILGTFFLKEFPARSVVVLFGPTSFVLILIKEELVRRWIQTKIGQAQLRKRIILAGSPEDAMALEGELRRQAQQSIEVAAKIDLNNASVETLVDLLHEHSANGVVLSARNTLFGQIERAIQACELEGVEVWLLADFFKTQISKTTLDDLYGRPMLVFRTTPEASWQAIAKHMVDFLGALVLLVFLVVPLAIVACLIRLTSPGPVLFRQQRSGLNGHPFTMLKFRSMVTNADQLKHELEALNEMSGPVFKLTQDPRITPIGRFLRKYSIDELPQLWNVVRGEMSLVGPRPLPVDEVKRFDDLAHRRRLSVRPGLTCLWQISGRNEVKDFKDWVRLDLEYIDNWSFWLDLKILLRTVPVVLMGTGAK